MDCAGHKGRHIDELIFIHIFGRPVGQLDNEAHGGHAGFDFIGGHHFAIHLFKGDVHTLFTQVPEPNAPVIIHPVGAVVVKLDHNTLFLCCRYGEHTEAQQQYQAQQHGKGSS